MIALPTNAFGGVRTEHNGLPLEMSPMTAVPSSVPSPCVGVCHIDDASGLCDGCQRTVDEITVWSSMHDRERLATWNRIAQRRRHAIDVADAGAKPNATSRLLRPAPD